MLDAMDWDTYWRFEVFRRRADPLDFRRWKRDSQRALRSLYPDGAPRLLDSTGGMGDHTVNLAEEGFDVEACDRSEEAVALTRSAVERAGLDVPVFRADWEDLRRPERYALIFNDELHSIYDEEALRAALVGLREALAPGGALIFFFADAEHPEPGHGIELLEWDWRRAERVRVAWDHTVDERTVTCTQLRRRGPDYIDVDHVYLDREGEHLEVRALTARRVYRWDWARLAPVLRDVGFVDLRSDHFDNVKGYTFALSRAFKPR